MSVFSEVQVKPLNKPAGKLLANGSVLVGGAVKVKFTVLQGPESVFASLPSRKATKPNDKGEMPYYPDVVIPDKKTYGEFQNLVRSEYQKVMGGGNSTGEEPQVTGDNVPF